MPGPIDQAWTGPREIASRADLRTFLRADADAAELGKRGRWLAPTYRYQVRLRVAEYADRCWRTPPGRIGAMALKRLHVRRGTRLGFTIPLHVAGPGLCLAHWGTIVAHPDARIGANCRIHVGVVIGVEYGETPTIGDNVYIGPGAKISGGVTIGDGCVIGANAVVTKSFPEKTIVVGAPGRALPRSADRWP